MMKKRMVPMVIVISCFVISINASGDELDGSPFASLLAREHRGELSDEARDALKKDDDFLRDAHASIGATFAALKREEEAEGNAFNLKDFQRNLPSPFDGYASPTPEERVRWALLDFKDHFVDYLAFSKERWGLGEVYANSILPHCMIDDLKGEYMPALTENFIVECFNEAVKQRKETSLIRGETDARQRESEEARKAFVLDRMRELEGYIKEGNGEEEGFPVPAAITDFLAIS